MSARAHLYAIWYSPWSERARWALDYHAVDYAYHEHVPFLGEPLLRWRARRAGVTKRRITAPLFIDEAGGQDDSMEIVARADALGSRPPLIDDAAEVEGWRARVEPALDTARARTTAMLIADRDAMREAAMAIPPKAFAGLYRPIATLGGRFIFDKYAMGARGSGEAESRVRPVLEEVRAALGDGAYLRAGRLTAADLLVASLLQGVEPIQRWPIVLRPATLRCWRWPEVAEEFADLIRWRDALYDRHRPRGPRS